MIGVTLEESPTLKFTTYDITPAISLKELPSLSDSRTQPEGTTFVSVVDPGVGSKRKSVVLNGENQYIVTRYWRLLFYLETRRDCCYP